MPESSGSNEVEPLTDSEAANEDENEEDQGRRRKKPVAKVGRVRKADLIHDLKAQRLEEQLELCKHDKYMKKLAIYKKEKQLGLAPSEFTREIHQQDLSKGNVISKDNFVKVC